MPFGTTSKLVVCTLAVFVAVGCKARKDHSSVKADESTVDVEKDWAIQVRSDLKEAKTDTQALKDTRGALGEAADLAERRAALREHLTKVVEVVSDLQSILLRMRDKLADPTVSDSVQNVARVTMDDFTSQISSLEAIAGPGGELDQLRSLSSEYAVELAANGPDRLTLRTDIINRITRVDSLLSLVAAKVDLWITAATGTGGGTGGGGAQASCHPKTKKLFGKCWAIGEHSGNCATACTSIDMVYDEATNDTTNDTCTQIASQILPEVYGWNGSVRPAGSNGADLGCYVDWDDSRVIRSTAPTTGATVSRSGWDRRFCACKNWGGRN